MSSSACRRTTGASPLGAAGLPLTAGRAIAVDPAWHGYGELYWIDAAAPTLRGAMRSYRRLVMALDTGSAIRGDVRADLYLGRGERAGVEAGRVRHTLLLVRLVPVAEGAPAAHTGRTMKRPLRPEEARLWAVVAATVRPGPGRAVPEPPPDPAPEPASILARRRALTPQAAGAGAMSRPKSAPTTLDGIEPTGVIASSADVKRSPPGWTCMAWTRTGPEHGWWTSFWRPTPRAHGPYW